MPNSYCNDVKLLKDGEYLSPPTKRVEDQGYRKIMGNCGGESSGERKAHEPTPTHYPRCQPDKALSALQDKIYRRSKTSQQEYGWNPDRQPGAGMHEDSLFDLPQLSRKECEKAHPSNTVHSNSCAPLPVCCPSGFYCSTPSGGQFMPVGAGRSERGKAPSSRSNGLLNKYQVIDPRQETGDLGHPCCPETRPLLMNSPRTMASSYRGMQHTLGPDTWPKEVYRDPAFSG